MKKITGTLISTEGKVLDCYCSCTEMFKEKKRVVASAAQA